MRFTLGILCLLAAGAVISALGQINRLVLVPTSIANGADPGVIINELQALYLAIRLSLGFATAVGIVALVIALGSGLWREIRGGRGLVTVTLLAACLLLLPGFIGMGDGLRALEQAISGKSGNPLAEETLQQMYVYPTGLTLRPAAAALFFFGVTASLVAFGSPRRAGHDSRGEHGGGAEPASRPELKEEGEPPR